MKRVVIVLALSVLSVFASALENAASSQYSFTISGAQTWTDAGVDLAAGDLLTLTAEAKAGGDSGCTAGGSHASAESAEKLPLVSAPAGALIAKTSENAAPTLVGESGSLSADRPGHLFLGFNQANQSACVFSVKVQIVHGASVTAAPVAQQGAGEGLTAPAAKPSTSITTDKPATGTPATDKPATATPSDAQNAAAKATHPDLKQQMSSAAQVFLKGQFGTGAAAPTESNNAVSGNAGPVAGGSGASTGGLKLPSVILDADLRKNIDGVPRRIHDHLGNLGDMVNFVFVGSQEKAQAALEAADWHVADVDSKAAGLKAIINTYEKKDYLQMPMSHLYLFDRMQDFGYEQAEAFSVVATRHHFRMWKAPFTWNNETVWVGAATHDTGFERDIRTGKLTHKIDPNVDDERENLASSLQKSGKTKSMTYYLPPSPVQEAKNASGGSYHSDGRLLVVFLN